MKRAFKYLTIAAAVLGALAAPAQADEYPIKPIQLVIPYVAGGGTDALARMVAQKMSDRLGQRVVPENRPGAGTALAAGLVARATPDGYTLLFGTMAHALNATMNPNLSFDSVNDFEFVGKVGQIGLMVVTNPKLKVNDLKGLVAQMRSQPGKAQFGSAGIGTPMHLGGELMKQVTKTDAVHVPYKGESAALTDLLGGQITFMLCSVTTCAPRAQDGSLKALAITATHRSPLAPSVPTVAEAGFPGAEVNTWLFIAAPKGTPTAVVAKLNSALNGILADDSFKTRAQAMGVELESRTTPEATKTLVKTEIAKWRPIINATGAQTQASQ
jgi:tripartite-type tricarboxylate transporter receptor subunit TctC